MLTIENVEVFGFEAAIRGMRNPKNSWANSDSHYGCYDETCDSCPDGSGCHYVQSIYQVGEKDLKLMQTLAAAGSDHGKFMRMLNVSLDIVAPLYWWNEFDTYKVGTVADSCSKMHKLLYKPFELRDFSFDQLTKDIEVGVAKPLVDTLNGLRTAYYGIDDERIKKQIWYAILQLLPESYNQRRTVQLNYQVLKNQYHARKNHKQFKWHTYCEWVETLPYAKELICG